jgi:hypothetical protein
VRAEVVVVRLLLYYVRTGVVLQLACACMKCHLGARLHNGSRREPDRWPAAAAGHQHCRLQPAYQSAYDARDAACTYSHVTVKNGRKQCSPVVDLFRGDSVTVTLGDQGQSPCHRLHHVMLDL